MAFKGSSEIGDVVRDQSSELSQTFGGLDMSTNGIDNETITIIVVASLAAAVIIAWMMK